jgi:protein-tyrosine phosphatase
VPQSVDNRFTLLFVCQANLCRSPMAERLARLRLERDAGSGVRVVSAGTRALEGSRMHPVAMQVLAERGADTSEFVSRQVTEKVLDRADLVLTATRHQRAVCVSMVPEMVGVTFTLRQFGRMVAATHRGERGDTGPDALRERMRAASAGRGRLQPVAPEEDDLADPVRDPIDAFRRCADAIDGVLEQIIAR